MFPPSLRHYRNLKLNYSASGLRSLPSIKADKNKTKQNPKAKARSAWQVPSRVGNNVVRRNT